jgi:antitoxin CptB
MTAPAPPPDSQRGRLAWHCRRGMKELDVLLLRWLDSRYAQASAGQRELFAQLLDVSDPQLASWLLGGERPPQAALAELIDAIASPAPGGYYVRP